MIRFRGDIEGLRALAVLLVIFDHLSFRGFDGGFIGVDVFFVISGYLITSLLAAEYELKASLGKGRGAISISGFYLRRARRILPAALAVIAAILIGARFLMNSLRLEQVKHDAIWTALFGSNINFIRQANNYFTVDLAASSPFRHYWSLAVEEQFYFVWPAVFLAIVAFHGLIFMRSRIRWRKRLAIGLVVIGGASFIWSIRDTAASPASAYFSTFTRGWELALGALLAVATTRATRLKRREAAAASFAGVALLLAGCLVIDGGSQFPGYVALLPTLGATLLILAGLTDDSPLPNRMLNTSPMRFGGRISYSLYLWHWPLIVFAAVLYPHASGRLSTRFGILVLTVSISALSYYVIERPTRRIPVDRLGDSFRRALDRLDRTGLGETGFGIAAFACAAALGLLVVLATHRGDPGRDSVRLAAGNSAVTGLQESRHRAASPKSDSSPTQVPSPGLATAYGALLSRWERRVSAGINVHVLPQALQPLRKYLANVDVPCAKYRLSIVEHEQECAWGNSNARYVAAITGDSHAGMWLSALEGALDPNTWALHPFTRSWCGWSGGSENIAASDAPRNEDCRALQEQTIEQLKRLRPTLLVLSEDGVHSEEQMAQAMNRFAGVAKHVVVLGHTPIVVPSFTLCLHGSSDISACTGHLSSRDAQDVALERRAAALFGASFIDTTPWFCSGLSCPSIIDGVPAFADGSHVTTLIAARLVPLLRASLGQVGLREHGSSYARRSSTDSGLRYGATT